MSFGIKCAFMGHCHSIHSFTVDPGTQCDDDGVSITNTSNFRDSAWATSMLRDEIALSGSIRLHSNTCKTLYILLPSSLADLRAETGPVTGEFVANEALKHIGATSSRPFFRRIGYGSLRRPKDSNALWSNRKPRRTSFESIMFI